MEPRYGTPGYIRPPSLLPILEHQDRFVSCDLCLISRYTSQKVIYRGRYPSKILFIGDSPDESANACGLPFVGIQGDLLSALIKDAGIPSNACGFTYAIICTPFTDKTRSELGVPSKQTIVNCTSRLKDLIFAEPNKTNPGYRRPIPKLVTLGKKAELAVKILKLDYLALTDIVAMQLQGGEESVPFARASLLLQTLWSEINDK